MKLYKIYTPSCFSTFKRSWLSRITETIREKGFEPIKKKSVLMKGKSWYTFHSQTQERKCNVFYMRSLVFIGIKTKLHESSWSTKYLLRI
ncbi:hypothetical protein BDF21DRAFT_203274 [Thamnidium elegans]|nr:hypothetical protein BDF21DRAFT_203274 [Thamnidium elegans]